MESSQHTKDNKMTLINPMKTALESAKLANNGRLIEIAMTDVEKRGAEKAVARGLMTKHSMKMPGWGYVNAYQLVA